jgi:hypothetical protein
VQPCCEMCSPVFLEYSCRFSAPKGGFHNLNRLNLPKPNSPHAKCSVKCPNQPKMLQLNPNFSGTFTTLLVTYLPNFTPIRDSWLQLPKSLFLRLNSNQAHTSLIYTYTNLFVKYRLNSMSFRASIQIPNLLWHYLSFKRRFHTV